MRHTKEQSDLRFESLNLALQVDAVVSKERAAANNPQHSLLFFIIHAVHTWELERQRLCANRLASLDSKLFGILEGAQIGSVFSHRSIHSLRLVLVPVVQTHQCESASGATRQRSFFLIQALQYLLRNKPCGA